MVFVHQRIFFLAHVRCVSLSSELLGNKTTTANHCSRKSVLSWDCCLNFLTICPKWLRKRRRKAKRQESRRRKKALKRTQKKKHSYTESKRRVASQIFQTYAFLICLITSGFVFFWLSGTTLWTKRSAISRWGQNNCILPARAHTHNRIFHRVLEI